jgi:excisionase family DNA binding protein
MPEDLINLEELTAFMPHHPSRHTIYQLTHKKQIPFYKIGKKLLFSKSEILNWLKNERLFKATV